ncbi:MAG: hypothetical protein LQ340_007563 [Diploschistes diacapsis]|nr:MAG: hypothetical protein LQ340_007563 [Diploschistes diacapsis]
MSPASFPQNRSPNTINLWACSRAWDEDSRPVRSGIGVWLGPVFKPTEHLSEWVDDPGNTHLRSEIQAGIRGLEQALIHYAHDIEGRNVGQVVIHTDSASLVDAAVIWIPQWQPRYLLTGDKEMADKKLYQRLSELIGIFHVQGVKVFFDRMDPRNIDTAADLAEAAMIRELPYKHNRDAWVSYSAGPRGLVLISVSQIVDPLGHSICRHRHLFIHYQPTLLSYFDNAETLQPSGLIMLGRGSVAINVLLCNGTTRTIMIDDVFHVPNSPINILSPPIAARLRPGFLIHDGEAVALAQETNRQTVLKLASGPQTLYPATVPREFRMRIPSKFIFLRGENEPPRLPPIPQNPPPIAYRLQR